MQARIGIDHRHFAPPHETVASLGARVLRRALDEAGWAPEQLDRLILVNSSGGDHPIPATANALLEALGVRNTVGAFDLNNACTGFVSALDVAARMVMTGVGRTAVVTVELLSRWIAPDVPRSYVVLADAAAALLLEPAPAGTGLLASDFGNDGSRLAAVTLQHGADTRIQFGVPGKSFFGYALEGMLGTAQAVFDRAGLTRADVDWFVLHQPNGALFDAFLQAFDIAPDRTVRLVDQIGSVGAASAAVGLDALRRQRPVKSGDRVLIVAVGAGASRGAVLWQIA
jgi:3-oxoacyl-(acyl-carrier-protein) synthase III